jgi:hypothetical protein
MSYKKAKKCLKAYFYDSVHVVCGIPRKFGADRRVINPCKTSAKISDGKSSSRRWRDTSVETENLDLILLYSLLKLTPP